MSSSTADKIMKSGLVVIIAHIIFKITGLIQNMALGHYFDKAETDAFIVAFEGIIFMIFLIGEESIGPAFLPIFLEEKNKKSEKTAWQFATGLLSIQTLLLVSVTLFITFQNESVVKFINLLGTGEFALKGEKDVFIAKLIKYMAFGLIGLSIGSTTYMILNGFKRFFWAAFGDTLTKIAVICT